MVSTRIQHPDKKGIDIKDKAISDIIEAVIGAYLLGKGHNPAIDVMCWFDLIENPSTIPGYSTMSIVEPEESSEPINQQGNILEEFEKNIGYKFKNKMYLSTAFTTQKHQEEENELSYEKLMFIGEGILYYIITRVIFDRFRHSQPGEMTALRAKIMNTFIFSCLAIKNNLLSYLQLSGIRKQMIQNISYQAWHFKNLR